MERGEKKSILVLLKLICTDIFRTENIVRPIYSLRGVLLLSLCCYLIVSNI